MRALDVSERGGALYTTLQLVERHCVAALDRGDARGGVQVVAISVYDVSMIIRPSLSESVRIPAPIGAKEPVDVHGGITPTRFREPPPVVTRACPCGLSCVVPYNAIQYNQEIVSTLRGGEQPHPTR